MWECGNTSTAPFHAMMHGIHVLLVDHDAEALLETAKQLELCQYKVTYVELASAGISMLLSGKAKFDVVVANINSPDLHGLKLLQHSVNLCIPVVLMSEDDNVFIAMRALEDGAFLYIKKPLSLEFMRCLWQHVVREKPRMIREREMYFASSNYSNPNPNPNPNPNMTGMMNKGKCKGKRGRNEDYSYSDSQQKGGVRKKMCTEWTQELHAKFENAVEQLGEGRCYPKEILELMNEPGLTRMQVASHLQKCRQPNWRSPDERKWSHQTPPPASVADTATRPKHKRFGTKPLFSSEKSRLKTEAETTNNNIVNNDGLNPRHDHYFNNMLDMDSVTRDLSARPHQPGIGLGGYHHHQTNANANASDEQTTNQLDLATSHTKSLWSSDTSNFDSDRSL